jgi:diguanylate cyclase (GGDEF)-like protein
MEFGESQPQFEGEERAEYERFYNHGRLVGNWVRAEYEKEEQMEINLNLAHGMFKRQDVINSLRETAEYDSLTGLMRRETFLETIETRFQTPRRPADLGKTHAVLFLDLDNFGPINKMLGHAAGDKCLAHTGNIINQNLQRADDFASRWGGEEFVVFLGDTNIEGAGLVAKLIQQGINGYVPSSEVGWLGVSIGITEYSHGTPFKSAINRADEAMLRAKDAVGKNEIGIY